MEKQTIYNADIRAIQNGYILAGDSVKLNELNKNEEFIIKGRYGKIIAAAKQYVSWYDFALQEHSTTNTDQVVKKLIWNNSNRTTLIVNEIKNNLGVQEL